MEGFALRFARIRGSCTGEWRNQERLLARNGRPDFGSAHLSGLLLNLCRWPSAELLSCAEDFAAVRGVLAVVSGSAPHLLQQRGRQESFAYHGDSSGKSGTDPAFLCALRRVYSRRPGAGGGGLLSAA